LRKSRGENVNLQWLDRPIFIYQNKISTPG